MGNTSRVRAHGEIRALRDEEWLRLHEAGKPTAELAEDAGVSVQLLRRALSRARKERDSRMQEACELSILAIGTDSGLEPASAAPRKAWWLELVPLFPVGPFTPLSECPHQGPIRTGSLFCCMVCSTSGMDGHPSLIRDPATDPKPEPRKSRTRRIESTSPVSRPNTQAAETRRQRRTRIFGSTSASEPGE